MTKETCDACNGSPIDATGEVCKTCNGECVIEVNGPLSGITDAVYGKGSSGGLPRAMNKIHTIVNRLRRERKY